MVSDRGGESGGENKRCARCAADRDGGERIRAVTACILPEENETEGRLVSGIEILPADNLEELCAYLNGAARSEKSKREKQRK